MSATVKTESFAAIITVAYLPREQAFETLPWEWETRDIREDVEYYLSSQNATLVNLFAVDDGGEIIPCPFDFPITPVKARGNPNVMAVWRDGGTHESEGAVDAADLMERFDEDEWGNGAIPKPTESSDYLGVYTLHEDGTATRWTNDKFDREYADYRGEVRQARRDATDLRRDYYASVL